MDGPNWEKRVCAVLFLCATAAISLPAQTFTTLDSLDGAYPYAGLVQGTDGNLYGTTSAGGSGGGTVFKIAPSGTLTTVYNFCLQSHCTDGSAPHAGLIQGTDGNFYGTTEGGGANLHYGTVFKITRNGALTTLYSFCSQGGDYCTDGAYPVAGLVQGPEGNFYGTTSNGGANDNLSGTVFKITPNGALATLSFDGADGSTPNAALVQGTDGNFYGTTFTLGTGPGGTVFKITPNGKLTTLYDFCSQSGCVDGQFPNAALTQGIDGNFYGTTESGGANNACGNGCGTIFKITPTGTLTTLYSLCSQSGCTDGNSPYAGLIQATDGNFYGTTYGGGTNGLGSVFKITPSGTLTTLHSFDYTDGAYPNAGLIQDTNGKFYGTAFGGVYGSGTVFSLDVGLGPFVETQPTSGKVGAPVGILGTDLGHATSVSFNGAAAVFKVVSSSLITSTVPAGATTGTVQVETPSGARSSNVPFWVRP